MKNPTINLTGEWEMLWHEGLPRIMDSEGDHRPWLPASIPGSAHTALQQLGILDDPNVGLNSLAARWVEEMFWTFRRKLVCSAEQIGQPARLVIETLEFAARITINGEEVGRHQNAHRPARFDLTGRLREGENDIQIELECGMHLNQHRPTDFTGMGAGGQMTKAAWCRKPLYQFGWDWHARLVNIGIFGSPRIEFGARARLDQISVHADLAPDLQSGRIHVRGWFQPEAQEVSLRARLENGKEMVSGSRIEGRPERFPGAREEREWALTIPIDEPQLWWPKDQGESYRYTVQIEVDIDGETFKEERKIGLRRVEMDQSPHPEEGRYCVLKVNNRQIFCRGANWVPPDMRYVEVSEDRTQELLLAADEANFNLLRIWGGGHYVSDTFLEFCDEHGILIWHDFMFACGQFPGGDRNFLNEVRTEATWQVRRTAHHPSLAVWCGSNETEDGAWNWNWDLETNPTHPDYVIFHHDLPKIVSEENPSALHWISSPWSPDYKNPRDPLRGNQHPWQVALWSDPGPDFLDYRKHTDRFATEGGMLGSSLPATIRQLYGEKEPKVADAIWEHHDNPFAVKKADSGRDGLIYEMFRLFTGLDPFTIDWERYVWLSGLLQAEGLTEYIANYRRRRWDSAAAIFWMFNDSWPVTHGWTVVDYYGRRKPAYSVVKRMFSPVAVYLFEEDGLKLRVVNDRNVPFKGMVRSGWFSFDGCYPVDEEQSLSLDPGEVIDLPVDSLSKADELDPAASAAFALLYDDQGEEISRYRLLPLRFGEMKWLDGSIRVEQDGDGVIVTSDVFHWGVCPSPEGGRGDELAFDLYPGIPTRLTTTPACLDTEQWVTGNRLLLGTNKGS